MTAGPLHPDNLPAGRDRSLGKGHGTESLGPSDSSDSGSDLKGAPGLAQQADESFAGNTAGPDVGDADLDSDSDRGGTGERASSGRDSVPDGIDIDTDRIESIPDLEQIADLDEEDEEGAPRRRRH